MPTVTTVGFFLARDGTEPMSLWRVPPQSIAWSREDTAPVLGMFLPASWQLTHSRVTTYLET
jgi:hypothetical protein